MAGNAFSIKFDHSGLDAALDRLNEGAKEQVRPAAQAGSQVLYEEVEQRAPQSPPGTAHIFTSRGKKGAKRNQYLYYSGDLKRSVYQAFSEQNSGDGRATYHIAWAKNESRSGRAVPYGYMVEYGTSKTPAQPFLRPSFDAKSAAALQAARENWEEGTRLVLAGLKT